MQRSCLRYLTLSLMVSALSSAAHADHIRFYNDITDRFAHKDWVTYKSEQGGCWATIEFLVDKSLAMFRVSRETLGKDMSEKYGYHLHIYGEYVHPDPLISITIDEKVYKVDRFTPLLQEFAEGLARGRSVGAKFKMKDGKVVNTRISTHGSSAALRFCEYIE